MSPNVFPSANTDSLDLFPQSWQRERAATLGHLAVSPGMGIFLIVLWDGGCCISSAIAECTPGGSGGGDKSLAGVRERERELHSASHPLLPLGTDT